MSDDLSNKTADRPGLIERLLRWLRLADYHEAREEATERIMSGTSERLGEEG